MALIIRHTQNKISRQCRKNIQLCFPELTAKQKDHLVMESIIHTSSAFLELAALWYHPINRVLGDITIDGELHFQDAPPKPRIIIVPHHGSWELMIYWLAQWGNFYTLYKPARNKNLDQYIFDKRSRNGAIMVPTNTVGLRSLLKGLRNNATCMILPDQRPGKKMAQAMAPFFGHDVYTSLLIKNLCSKVDCDVFIGAMTRDLDSAQYRLSMRQLDHSQFLQKDSYSAAYLNQAIQDFVTPKLSQYQWSYRRFPYQAYRSLD